LKTKAFLYISTGLEEWFRAIGCSDGSTVPEIIRQVGLSKVSRADDVILITL
jgi:hypothetical protein